MGEASRRKWQNRIVKLARKYKEEGASTNEAIFKAWEEVTYEKEENRLDSLKRGASVEDIFRYIEAHNKLVELDRKKTLRDSQRGLADK